MDTRWTEGFDYTFTDRELQEVLGIIEQKASGVGDPIMDSPCFESFLAREDNFPLQFQPREPIMHPMGQQQQQLQQQQQHMPQQEQPSGSNLHVVAARLGEGEAAFGLAPTHATTAPYLPQHVPAHPSPAHLNFMGQAPLLQQSGFDLFGAPLPGGLATAGIPAGIPQPPATDDPYGGLSHLSLIGVASASSQEIPDISGGSSYSIQQAALPRYDQQPAVNQTVQNTQLLGPQSGSQVISPYGQQQPSNQLPSQPVMALAYQTASGPVVGAPGGLSRAMGRPNSATGGGRGGNRAKATSAVAEKPISHSSVEKQRRDRINTLIDELRELVPPSRSSQRNDGADSKRPKHVVLSDTIALLKGMHMNGRMPPDNARRRSSGDAMKEDDDHSDEQPSKGSGSGQLDQEEQDLHAACSRELPQIPMQPNQVEGVTVEKGAADVMYVQVKCRDRRGLLSDVVNALKALPLEIKTAAITTTGDGVVRDVFEILPDDISLGTGAIQTMVQDALAVQFAEGVLVGKKHKLGNL